MLPHCDREAMGYHGRSGEIEPPNGVISSNQQAIKGTRLVGAAELQHRAVPAGELEKVVGLQDHLPTRGSTAITPSAAAAPTTAGSPAGSGRATTNIVELEE